MKNSQTLKSKDGTNAMQLPLVVDAHTFVASEGDTYAASGSENKFGRLISLRRQWFIQSISDAENSDSLERFRASILSLKNLVAGGRPNDEGMLTTEGDSDAVSFRKDILVQLLDQMLESYTLERARYYLRRLKKSVSESKTNAMNDLDLSRWQEYDDIITDSLWVVDKRDTSGAHLGWYWGNFIPQIPNQMLRRYTKKGDWVLDTFAGSGTTLIECKRLGRNGIGVELNPDVAAKAAELVGQESNKYSVVTDIIVEDSRRISYDTILRKHNIDRVQLIIMHPPYHDIIKFSSNANDLSNAKDTQSFLKMFGEVVDNAAPHLENGRHLVVVIGDKYAKGEWVPLGFYCMNEVMQRGFALKSIVVKNFDETRAKRNQKELWRYRALQGGFYVFKHEYVLLFKKI